MIGCGLAGAVAGINFSAVMLLTFLWYRGARELRELERLWRLRDSALQAKSDEHGNGL